MKLDIQYSRFPMQIQNKGLISGYASWFNKRDHQGDMVVPGAFSNTLKAWKLMGKKPKMLWQHNPHNPIGIWTHLRQDTHGLYVEGRLALGTSVANDAYLLLKEGALDGLSIGFRTVQAVQDLERKARLLLDIDLIEISLVTFGANPGATIRDVKFFRS